MLSLNLDGKITNIKGLNITYLVNTTVHLCTSQDLLWDPRKDLLWLCRKYGKEIQSIRVQLNARQVKENFLGTAFFSTLSVKDQRLCYHVLLGKEPPPSMFLTPAPVHGQPTGHAARPPVPSHKSAPSLKDIVQQQSDFLKPPMHGRSKTAPGASFSGLVTKASPNAMASSHTEGVAPKPTRESRSRYRTSSAPTTPNASRSSSLEAGTAQPAKDISDHMQHHSMIYQAQSVNMQNLAPATKPHVVQTKKSLPRMHGHPTSAQAVPVFANKTTTTPQENAQTTPAAGHKPFETKSRPQDDVLKTQSHNSALPSAAGAQPHVVAHTHPAHKIVAQRNSMLPKGHIAVTTTYTVSHTKDRKTESPSGGLSVVGPEGLHPTPPRPTIQPQNSRQPAAPAAPTMQNKTQETSTNFVFELDAASPQVETFAQAVPSTKFVAELPADNNPSPQPVLQKFNAPPETPISPPQGPAHRASVSAYSNSPVSPPTTFVPLADMIQHIKPLSITESPRTVPALEAPKLAPSPSVFDSHPPSLMIGFRGPQHSSNAKPRMRSESQSWIGSNPPAALNKYQRYYSPPNSREASPNNISTSAPNSRHASPNRGPVYKAYAPPLTPPIHPKPQSVQLQQLPPTRQIQVLTPPAQADAAVSLQQQGAPVPMDRASEFVGRVSPPAILRAGANIPQPLKSTKASHLPNPLAANPPTPQNASHVKHDSHQEHRTISKNHDVSANRYSASVTQQHPPQVQAYRPLSQSTAPQYIAFSTQHAPPTEPRRQSSLHQRNASTESNTSTTSHDSEKLAQEYQLDLPPFDDGFGAKPKTGDTGSELKQSYRPSYAGTGYESQYQLGSPDFGNKQGKFMDEFHFS